jgi:hypothetical protein
MNALSGMAVNAFSDAIIWRIKKIMAQWEKIKTDYEQGLSLRTLSLKYGLSKSGIHKHAMQEEWTRTGGCPLIMDIKSGQSGQEIQPVSATITLARDMIEKLATIASVPLDLKDHKLLADALSQYNKILVSCPAGEVLSNDIDWSMFTQAELAILQPIFAAAETRAREKQA